MNIEEMKEKVGSISSNDLKQFNKIISIANNLKDELNALRKEAFSAIDGSELEGYLTVAINEMENCIGAHRNKETIIKSIPKEIIDDITKVICEDPSTPLFFTIKSNNDTKELLLTVSDKEVCSNEELINVIELDNKISKRSKEYIFNILSEMGNQPRLPRRDTLYFIADVANSNINYGINFHNIKNNLINSELLENNKKVFEIISSEDMSKDEKDIAIRTLSKEASNICNSIQPFPYTCTGKFKVKDKDKYRFNRLIDCFKSETDEDKLNKFIDCYKSE